MPTDYKYYAGRTSATALGWIAGNYKGAVLADQLYQKYHNMGSAYQVAKEVRALQNKRKRGFPILRIPKVTRIKFGKNPSFRAPRRSTTGSGRHVTASSSGKARARSVGSSFRTSGGNNNLNNSRKMRKIGKIATRKRSSLKVPKKLAKQITKVVDGIGSSGYRCQVYNDVMSLGPATLRPSRHFIFGNTQQSARGLFVNFSPAQVLTSASILFNAKTPELLYPPSTTGQDFQEDDDSIFDILSQSVEYLIKNNSQRHVLLTMTVMTPKENTDTDVVSTITDSIQTDVNTFRWAGSASRPPIKESPLVPWQQSPTLKTYYKMEQQTVKLDPGSSTNFVVHGYTGIFNWKKSIKQDQTNIATHWEFSKNDTKIVVFDVVVDMITVTGVHVDAGKVGRWLKEAGNTGFALSVETKEQIRIKAPKIKSTTKNSKVDHYEDYLDSIPTATRALTTVDVDDEGRTPFIPMQG